MLLVSEVAIDWSTAAVVSSGDGKLELTVQLIPEPDSFFNNAISVIGDRRRTEARGESWWISVPSFGQWMIGGIDPDAPEGPLKEALDQIVSQANIAAARDQAEHERMEAADKAQAKSLDEAARRMTDQFRAT